MPIEEPKFGFSLHEGVFKEFDCPAIVVAEVTLTGIRIRE